MICCFKIWCCHLKASCYLSWPMSQAVRAMSIPIGSTIRKMRRHDLQSDVPIEITTMMISWCEPEPLGCARYRVVSSSSPNVWLPNESFGRPNKPSGTTFRSTFQGREYSIWAKKRCKVCRKVFPDGLFGLPKDSFGLNFGEHRGLSDIPKSSFESNKIAVGPGIHTP
jgi:hypothetical protein